MLSTVSQQYKKNGYYIASNVLSQSALQKTLYEMDIVIVQQLNRLGYAASPTDSLESVHEHMRLLHAQDQTSYLQSLKLWAKLFSMQALIMNDHILAITAELGIGL